MPPRPEIRARRPSANLQIALSADYTVLLTFEKASPRVGIIAVPDKPVGFGLLQHTELEDEPYSLTPPTRPLVVNGIK
jgi:hypothetical protein